MTICVGGPLRTLLLWIVVALGCSRPPLRHGVGETRGGIADAGSGSVQNASAFGLTPASSAVSTPDAATTVAIDAAGPGATALDLPAIVEVLTDQAFLDVTPETIRNKVQRFVNLRISRTSEGHVELSGTNPSLGLTAHADFGGYGSKWSLYTFRLAFVTAMGRDELWAALRKEIQRRRGRPLPFRAKDAPGKETLYWRVGKYGQVALDRTSERDPLTGVSGPAIYLTTSVLQGDPE
jgi:hypothetical protein